MRKSFSLRASVGENSTVAQSLRAEFPIFTAGSARAIAASAGEEETGLRVPELKYLDTAATSQKPRAVLEAETTFYSESCANVHRAIHSLGEDATRLYELSRKRMAGFVGAQFAEEIIFTRGTTEAINLLAHSLGETLQAGDEIILTEMEHHANIVPWQQLAARRGIVLRYIPISDDGELDLDTYQRLLNPRTRLVSFTLSSNVLGSITPAKKIAAMAHNQGALVLMDAAQAAPRTVLDVQDLGADFLALSAHKMYGPFGIGLLYGRRELLEGLPPFMGGGDMIGEVSLEGFTPNELPYKFEAGTPPIAQAVAMAAAADWLESVNLEALGKYEAALAQRLLAALDKIPEIRVLGRAKERSGIVAFTLDGVHAHDLVAYLDRSGFALRAGHHCAHPLARRLGIISSARASFGAYNTIEEVDQLAELLLRAKDDL